MFVVSAWAEEKGQARPVLHKASELFLTSFHHLDAQSEAKEQISLVQAFSISFALHF